MTKQEIRAALNSGSMRWSDLNPASAVSNRSYRRQELEDELRKSEQESAVASEPQKPTKPVQNTAVNQSEQTSQDAVFNPATDSIVPTDTISPELREKATKELKTSEKGIVAPNNQQSKTKKDYSLFDLAGNSFKNFAGGVYNTGMTWFEAKTLNEITPLLEAKDILSESANDPNTYKLIDLYAKGQTKNFTPYVAPSDPVRDKLNAEEKWKYDLNKQLEKNAVDSPDLLDNVVSAFKAPLRVLDSWAKNPTKILGDIENPIRSIFGDTDQNNRIFKNSAGDIQKDQRADRQDRFDVRSGKTTIGSDLLAGVNEGASKTTAPMLLGTSLIDGTILPKIAPYAAAAYGAYSNSDAVNQNTGWRRLDPAEIPDELQETNARLGNSIIALSKMNGKFRDKFPSIDEIVAGKNINNTSAGKDWKDKATKALYEDYKANKDWAGKFQYMKDRTAAPDEEINTEYPTLANVTQSLGASSSMIVPMIVNQAATAAVSGLTRGLISANGTRPVLDYLVTKGGILSGAMSNAYMSVKSRESEAYSQLLPSYTKRFSEQLAKEKDPTTGLSYDIFDGKSFSDKKLLEIVDRNKSLSSLNSSDVQKNGNIGYSSVLSNYDNAISELNKTGALSKETRGKLLSDIQSGFLKTKIDDKINSARSHALSGVDEYLREYMSMLAIDMAQNSYISAPFNANKIAAVNKFDQSLFGSINRTSEMVSDYLVNSTAGKMVNKVNNFSLAGVRVGAVPEFVGRTGKRMVVEGLSEAFLEENPQQLIQYKYEDGKLKDSNNLMDAITNTANFAVSAHLAQWGVGEDAKYQKGINENFVMTLLTTSIHTGVMGLPGTIKEMSNAQKEQKAKAFVKGNVIKDMQTADRVNKTNVYVDAVTKGKEEYIVNYLNELAQNPPEGISTEDIKDEARIAQRTMAVANNKKILGYANRAGGVGSEAHKLLTALFIDHEESANQDKFEAVSNLSEFEAVKRDKFKDSSFKEFFDQHNENNPENPISTASQNDIFNAIAEAKVLNSILFVNKAKDKISQTKLDVLNRSLNKERNAAVTNLHNQLISNGLISKEDVSDPSLDNLLSKVDELDIPSIENDFLIPMGKSKISLMGYDYNNYMKRELMNNPIEKQDKLSTQDHDIYIDEILDAYRTKKKEELEAEKVKEVVDEVKSEVSEEEEPIVPTYESTSEELEHVAEVVPAEAESPIPTETPDIIPIVDTEAGAVEDLTGDVDSMIDEMNSGIQSDIVEPDQNPDKPVDIEPSIVDNNAEVLADIKDNNDLEEVYSEPDTEIINDLSDDITGLISTETAKHDRISRTLFADVKIPIIREFLMNPDAFKSAKVKIVVNRHRSGTTNTYTVPASVNQNGVKNTITGEDYTALNDFDVNLPETWDNAFIKVDIKFQDGKIERALIFTMKNPGERDIVVDDSGMKKYSPEEVQALRDFRNSIISEYAKTIADPSLELRMKNGFERGIAKYALNRDKNGRAVQRALNEIVGLIDESDVNKLGVHNLTVAYGRGERGGNLVVSLFESMGISNSENSGSIFITKPDPLNSNEEVKIKVNKTRFSDEAGTAELVYKLAVDMRGSTAKQITISDKGEVIETTDTSPYGLTPALLLSRIVNFDRKTNVSADGKDFLKNKQFYVESGILHYSENTIPLSLIKENEKAEILKFINDNLTWIVDKNDLWNSDNNTDNLVSDLFPGIKSYLDRNSDKGSVSFAPGVTFSKEDMGITWTAWLIKNKKLVSDIGDGVFEPPFLFMTDVVAVPRGSEDIVSIKDGAYNTSPVAEVKSSVADDVATEYTPDPTEIAEETKTPAAEVKPLDFFDDFMGGVPSLIDVNNLPTSTLDAESAVRFLREKLGDNFEASVIDDVIALANGGFAQGLTGNDLILLSRLAQKGTEFHEAFHRASLLLIPRRRRMAIYDNIRNTNEEFKNATDSQIEEMLAEKFRERVLSNEVDIANGTVVNRVFRKMYNALNAYNNFKDRDVERLFRDIELGILKGARPSKGNLHEFAKKYEEGAPKRFRESGLTTIKTVEAKDRIVNSLSYYLFRISGIETIDNISKLDFNGLKASIAKLAEKYKAIPERQTQYELFTEIHDRFDDYFLKEIKKSVKNTGITELTDTKDDLNEEIVSKEAASHDKASYEISKRDNIRAEVKFFIRTIPESEMVNNTAAPKADPLSLLPSFVKFELAWNTMIYELHKENTVQKMKDKISSLANEKKNPFFIMLERRLATVDDNFLTKFWNTMYSHRHDYINTVYNANSTKDGNDYEKSIRNISSNIDRAERELPIFWGQNILSGGVVYSMTENGRVFNKKNAEAIVEAYKALAKSVHKNMTTEEANKSLEVFTSLLSKLSIDVDGETMDFMINNKYPGFSREQAINAIINDYKSTAQIFTTILPDIIKKDGNKGNIKLKEVTPKVLFGGERSIKEYALAYAKVHPNANETMAYGADGATLYQISSRNAVTDVIDRVSGDAAYLKDVLSVPINQGSILFNQIANGTSKGISFGTFVKIYEEGVADQGRDYFDISPLEDYTIKMTNLLSGNIALPAMADKKTYGFIFGIKMPDMVSRGRGVQRMSWFNNQISYPKEAVDIFDGYYKAEFEAIKQAWQQVKDANGTKDQLVENYHYQGAKSNKWAGGHGNGLRFRYMDILHVNSTTPGDQFNGVFDLNDYIDNVIKTKGPQIGEVAAMDEAIARLDKKFFSESYENRSKMISSTITSLVKKEIDYAAEIGLITKNEVNYVATMDNEATGVKIGDKVNSISYFNNAIDASIFNFNLEQYKKAGIDSKSVNMVAITNIMANTTINSIISEFETDKLISKDSAFYLNTDDKTKRLSSVLSTGTALRTSFPQGHVLQGISSFNVAEVSDSIIKSTELGTIKNMSYAAQVNRLMQQSGVDVISDLSDIYSDPNRKAELDELKGKFPKQFNLAEALVDAQSKEYEKVNVTDATAYISPYMYRSLMTRLGEDYFTPEMNEIFDILESDDFSWMNDPTKYAKVEDLAIHPLKMVYFGESFQNGLNIPKLNKMALFILPKFLATGDLKTLYDRMNNPAAGQQKVDMVAFSTAVKVGTDKPVSIHNDKNEQELSDLSKMKVVPQSFDYLRHQLPTEPHESAEMSIATQVQKASMGNIVATDIYPNIEINGKKGATGAQLVQEWNGAMSELSDRGKIEVEKQFGIKVDETTGNYSFNTEKMYNFLAQEAEKSNMPSDVVEILGEYDKENPDANPLQALVDNAFVESKILSNILKKTVDIKAPGGMFIQMTPFGLKHMDDSSAAYRINGGKKLRFLNSDGSMDCVVSITLFKDRLPQELNTYDEKVNWLRENNVIGENANPAAMGYRIPTQGLSSVSGLKIVDVLPEFMGDTIVLPYEFTALTGSDFDVDKLYITRLNYETSYTYDKDEATEKEREAEYTTYINTPNFSPRAKKDIVRAEIPNFDDDRARVEFANKRGYFYDIKNSAWATVRHEGVEKTQMDDSKADKWKENSTKAIQNRFIDVMMAVVTNPNSVNETRIPLDAMKGEVLKTLAIIDEKSGGQVKLSGMDKATLSYESKKKIEYSGGKQGIPTFALAGVHHVLTQIAKLRFKNNGTVNKFGLANLGDIYGKDGVRILDWLSAMVNAHVDVAKDPYIIRMGVNQYTHKMTSLLLRTGYGAKTFLFLSQPALKEAYKIMDTKGSEYLSGVRNAKSTTIEKQVDLLIVQYKENARKSAKNDYDRAQFKKLYKEGKYGKEVIQNENVFDNLNLVNGLARKDKTFDYYYHQLIALETFKELSPLASSLAEVVKYSQVDTKKAGNSFSSQRLFFNKVKELISTKSSFANLPELFLNTFIYKKLQNSAGLAAKLGQGVLFRTTKSVEISADKVLAAAGRYGQDNRELISKVNKYIDSKIKSEFFDKLAEDRGVNVPGLFFGSNTIAKRLFAIQQKFPQETQDNVFLRGMSAEMYAPFEQERPDHIRPRNNNTNEPGLVEEIKQHFSSLLDSQNAEIKKFAEDFILYQFYSTGDNHASNTVKISEYDRRDLSIPTEDGGTMSYYDFVRNKLGDLSNMDEALTDTDLQDIFINKWYDKDLVSTVENFTMDSDPEVDDGKPFKVLMPQIMSTKGIDGVQYPLSFVNTKSWPLFGKDEQGIDTYYHAPFVKLQFFPEEGNPFHVLYKWVGNVPTDSEKSPYQPMYIAIDKKGSKKDAVSVVEHNSDKSMIKANILPQSFNGVNKITGAEYAQARVYAEEYNRLLNSRREQNELFNFDDEIYDPYNLVEDISSTELESVISSAVEVAIISGDYTIANLEQMLDTYDSVPSEAMRQAKYEFAKRILERSDELTPSTDIINQTGEESVLEAIKTSVEAYLRPILEANKADEREPLSLDFGENIKTISLSNIKYSRDLVEKNPKTIYVFTDNTDRTSGTTPNVGGWYAKKYGEGLSFGSVNNPTTAVIRGANNAFPISTMKWFYKNHNVSVNDARWIDSDIVQFKSTIDDEINQIKIALSTGNYDNVVIPSGDGFFNSKIADISKTRTPVLYDYLKNAWSNFENEISRKDNTKSAVSNKEAVLEITSKDRIIWAHPGIGKSYAKEQGEDIIVLDDDYKEEHRALIKMKRDGAPAVEYEQALLDYWNKAKEDAKESGKQLFVSDLPILKRFPDDFDKVLNMSDETFAKRSEQRGEVWDNENASWKVAINDVMGTLDQSKVVTTDRYMSDILGTKESILPTLAPVAQSEIERNVNDIAKFREAQGLNVKTVEELWSTYRFKIARKAPGTTMADIQKVSDEIGLDKLEEYIKKCY